MAIRVLHELNEARRQRLGQWQCAGWAYIPLYSIVCCRKHWTSQPLDLKTASRLAAFVPSQRPEDESQQSCCGFQCWLDAESCRHWIACRCGLGDACPTLPCLSQLSPALQQRIGSKCFFNLQLDQPLKQVVRNSCTSRRSKPQRFSSLQF